MLAHDARGPPVALTPADVHLCAGQDGPALPVARGTRDVPARAGADGQGLGPEPSQAGSARGRDPGEPRVPLHAGSGLVAPQRPRVLPRVPVRRPGLQAAFPGRRVGARPRLHALRDRSAPAAGDPSLRPELPWRAVAGVPGVRRGSQRVREVLHFLAVVRGDLTQPLLRIDWDGPDALRVVGDHRAQEAVLGQFEERGLAYYLGVAPAAGDDPVVRGLRDLPHMAAAQLGTGGSVWRTLRHRSAARSATASEAWSMRSSERSTSTSPETVAAAARRRARSGDTDSGSALRRCRRVAG